MTTFEEAYNIVISSPVLLKKETVILEQALSRTLAEDISSDTDIPPFDKSAMDGYACRREDLQNELESLETIAAGSIPSKPIGKNQCSKIMTGAKIPDGADCVIMVEHTEITDKNKICFKGKNTANNISYKAEDVKKGEIVLKKGVLIQPQHIAVLASAGCYNTPVYKRAKVAVISTGDELVEPYNIPSSVQIRNSNAYQLITQALKTGAIPAYYGIAKDDPHITKTLIDKAFSENDVVLITGGVSMGDFDFIPEVLKENSIKILFEKLDVKPGRPTVFGTCNNKYIFGLPGNPVSSFVIFEMLVKPFLYKMMGYVFLPKDNFIPLEFGFTRKKSDRLSWIPVRYNKKGNVEIIEYHGSAHIHSLCFADGIITIPKDVNEIKNGERVSVRQI